MRVKSLILSLTLAGAASLCQAGVVLYNNGPAVDANGRSVRQASDTFFGFGTQGNLGNAVADDFSFTGEDWLLESIDFFAFQNSASAFTLQSVSWRLVAGDLNSGTVVASGTTALTDGGRVGYRVLHSTPNNTVRPIYQAVADIEDVLLEAGTYWLSWSMTGSLSSGPWIPPTADGALGNAMQSAAGGAFVPLFDNNDSVALPFVLKGQVVPEPATAGLVLVAGLGMLAANARRRRHVRQG
jgi:hypothetical protein